MTHHHSVHQNGYTKKELIKILEEIDADRYQMKNRTEKPNTGKADNGSGLTSAHGENR